MKYYDIGINLFCSQFKNPEDVLSRAAARQITCILTGSDMEENRTIQRFAATHDVYGTCGVHPHNADSLTEADLLEIREIAASNPKILAIGECGLDFNRNFSKRQNQFRALEAQIRIAEELNYPLFLHERDASREMCRIFSEHPDICRRSVIHCFTGTRDELSSYLEMGFHIGITGWICDDRRASALRDAVSILPPDRVMLETDSPYLVPKNIPGLSRINVPENIVYVARTLSEYMHIPEADLIAHAAENTVRFFGLPDTAVP